MKKCVAIAVAAVLAFVSHASAGPSQPVAAARPNLGTRVCQTIGHGLVWLITLPKYLIQDVKILTVSSGGFSVVEIDNRPVQSAPTTSPK